MIVFVAFWILLSLTLLARESRESALSRTRAQWIIDGSGLVAQGILVPATQATFLYAGLRLALPGREGTLGAPAGAAFLLSFVAIDYLYYWNHRLLHSRALWAVHRVHHSAERMDVLVTSRNTLWTPLVLAYLWLNALFAYLLRDPAPFLLGVSLTYALDLWRHTRHFPRLWGPLRGWLITPHEHAWHHSRDTQGVNFGANLAIWDRLHGTFHSPGESPAEIGAPVRLDWKRQLFLPFGSEP